MTNLSTECLIQLTKLGYDATPFNQILKQNADRKSGSAGMPRPISYAVFCLKKKNRKRQQYDDTYATIMCSRRAHPVECTATTSSRACIPLTCILIAIIICSLARSFLSLFFFF